MIVGKEFFPIRKFWLKSTETINLVFEAILSKFFHKNEI